MERERETVTKVEEAVMSGHGPMSGYGVFEESESPKTTWKWKECQSQGQD